jgi:tRNA A-37 threonylcarbamoyl transferase component Bud32
MTQDSENSKKKSADCKYLQSGGYGDVFLLSDGHVAKIYHQPGYEKKEFHIANLLRHKLSNPTTQLNVNHLLTHYDYSYESKSEILSMYQTNSDISDDKLKRLADAYKRHEKIPCLRMSYVEGDDGITYHKKYGFMPESLAINLMIQLLEAIQEFHSFGLLHGDIKPENLIIHRSAEDESYHLTLIDYGLAIRAPNHPYGYIDDRRLKNMIYQWHMDVKAFQQGRYYLSSELCSAGKTFLGFTGCRLRYKSQFNILLRKITCDNPLKRGTIAEAIADLKQCHLSLSMGSSFSLKREPSIKKVMSLDASSDGSVTDSELSDNSMTMANQQMHRFGINWL